MNTLRSSVQVEETWVDGKTERLLGMPTATSAFELDVSTMTKMYFILLHFEF